MSIQSISVTPKIEWDDGVVFIFSWNNRQFLSGFAHLQVALALAVGTQTQINAILQQLSQTQVQTSTDPQSWLETALLNKSVFSAFKLVIWHHLGFTFAPTIHHAIQT